MKASSDSSSGTSLDTASTNTGPMGAGGNCGSEDADQSNRQLRANVVAGTSLPVCLRSISRMCSSGWSRFKPEARFNAATA